MRQSWHQPGGSRSNEDEPDFDASCRQYLMNFQTFPPKKNTRTRTSFTTAQLQYLEDRFKEHPYATAVLRREISNELNLPQRCIQLWYQNRRIKEKYLRKKNTASKFYNRSSSVDFLNKLSEGAQDKNTPWLRSLSTLPKAASSKEEIMSRTNMWWYRDKWLKENFFKDTETNDNYHQRSVGNKYELSQAVEGGSVPTLETPQTILEAAINMAETSADCNVWSQNQWMNESYNQNKQAVENFPKRPMSSEHVYELRKVVQEGSIPTFELSQSLPEVTISRAETSTGCNMWYQNQWMIENYSKNNQSDENIHQQSMSSKYIYELNKMVQERSEPTLETVQTLPKVASSPADRRTGCYMWHQSQRVKEDCNKDKESDKIFCKFPIISKHVNESSEVAKEISMRTLESPKKLDTATASQTNINTKFDMWLQSLRMKQKSKKDKDNKQDFHKLSIKSERAQDKLTVFQEKNMTKLESHLALSETVTSKAEMNTIFNNKEKVVKKVPTFSLNYYQELTLEPDSSNFLSENNIEECLPSTSTSQPDYKSSAEFSIESYKKYKSFIDNKYKGEEIVDLSVENKETSVSGNTTQSSLLTFADSSVPYYYTQEQDSPQDLSMKKRRSN